MFRVFYYQIAVLCNTYVHRVLFFLLEILKLTIFQIKCLSLQGDYVLLSELKGKEKLSIMLNFPRK